MLLKLSMIIWTLSEIGVPPVDNSVSESLKQSGRLKPPGGPHVLHSVCVAATGGTFIKYILVKFGEVLDHWSAAASAHNHIVQSEERTETERSNYTDN